MRLMFMDERFAHPRDHDDAKATSLTALIVDPERHSDTRASYYALLLGAIPREPGVWPNLPDVHAMNLFPDATDEVRLDFLLGVARLALTQDFQIYRVGYKNNRHFGESSGDEKHVLSLCLTSIQFCIERDNIGHVIWPVMELDRSYKNQDQRFPGSMQNLDWMTTVFDGAGMSLDNQRWGEILYHTKRSIYGAMTDCFSYILHQRFRRDAGEVLTEFKRQVAAIGDDLAPLFGHNEVIDLHIGQPPEGYKSEGPIRFVTPIVPGH